MIAAVAAAPSASNGMPFNWFDVLVVVVLGFGLFRGRRNGMSRELLPVLEWLVLVPVCGLVYPKIAAEVNGLFQDMLWSCLVGYLAPAVAVLVVFKILKNVFGEKLANSDFFKGGEYYLAMLAGTLRYACALLFVLALLNARVYTPAEIAQQASFDQKTFGGGVYQGNYFPRLSQVQASVFKQSFLGPRIKDYLGLLLINTGQPGTGGAQPPRKQPVIKIGN
jgi:uncharacterized membrane protein required for colicin V production